MNKISELKKYYEQKISWSEEDGVFVVRFPELPGCTTHGRTREEAVKNAEEALESHLMAIERVEGKLPQPLAMQKEKKFPLRVKPEIYQVADEDASSKGISFNAYVNEALKDYATRNRQTGAFGPIKRRPTRPVSTKKRA